MKPYSDPPSLRTYDQWKMIGYVVKKGEKAKGFVPADNKWGRTGLFSKSQVKEIPYFDTNEYYDSVEYLSMDKYFDDIGDR